jgi:hypothetical protein
MRAVRILLFLNSQLPPVKDRTWIYPSRQSDRHAGCTAGPSARGRHTGGSGMERDARRGYPVNGTLVHSTKLFLSGRLLPVKPPRAPLVRPPYPWMNRRGIRWPFHKEAGRVVLALCQDLTARSQIPMVHVCFRHAKFSQQGYKRANGRVLDSQYASAL